ncbi:transcription factor IBH1-like 1 [Papaver somniferum]|uniref:transcription factor IBH1-like 1 n=1 Tax=Papaver somniferum TaxID=3469 RepID=UPI000E6F7BAA|nr:transcription factor IBH1-like 1 [Papaver somniferum]
MRPTTTAFKQEFLKKWLVGLKICSSSMNNMNIVQRKKTIKLSPDVAMASARDGKTLWSRALISKASKQDDDNNKIIVEKILGDDKFQRVITYNNSKHSSNGSFTSKKVLRRSRSRKRKCTTPPSQRVLATSIAKRLVVKKTTQVLKTLVPGGESMVDDISLLEETLDYISSLRAQVDVMRRLVNASNEVSENCK